MYETCEHVPRFKVHERANEVQSVCGEDGDNNILKNLIGAEKLREVLPTVDSVGNSQIHGVCCAPRCDDIAKAKKNHGDAVSPFGTLGSIPKRADKDDKQDANIEIEENFKHVFSGATAQEIECIGTRIAGSRGYKLIMQ